MPERVQQRRLRALAQLEREHVGAVQDARPAPFERSHVGERQRNGARVAAHVRARACLVEVQRRRRRLHVAERGLLQVERLEPDAAPLERREERLLPLGVFEQNH